MIYMIRIYIDELVLIFCNLYMHGISARFQPIMLLCVMHDLSEWLNSSAIDLYIY